MRIESKLEKFINLRASIECEIMREEVDILCIKFDEDCDKDAVPSIIKTLDIGVYKLIIVSITKILSDINSLLEKNNIHITQNKWIRCETIINSYIEHIANYYYHKRVEFLDRNDIGIKIFYVRVNVMYNDFQHVIDNLTKYNHRQFVFLKNQYSYSNKSINKTTYYITVLALILSLITLALSYIT